MIFFRSAIMRSNALTWSVEKIPPRLAQMSMTILFFAITNASRATAARSTTSSVRGDAMKSEFNVLFNGEKST